MLEKSNIVLNLSDFIYHINYSKMYVFFPPRFLYFMSPTSVNPPQTVMVSLEGLTKIVDPSQLTADFDGSLEYNHDDWIEVLMLCLFCII